MTTSTAAVPVRRSALDGVHRQLVPAGDDARLHWPMSYGDPDGERRAVAVTVALAEPGLYDKWIVRGRGALAACRACGLDGRPGSFTPAAPGGINIWTIADDEVWLVADAPIPGGPPMAALDFGPVVASLRAAATFVTDVSSGWAILRLVGPRVRDLLEELVAEDLSAAVVPDLAILQVPLAGCRVIVSRRDYEAVPGFTLLVARDEAEYLWDVITHLGEPHGIRPVGTSALLLASGASSGVAR